MAHASVGAGGAGGDAGLREMGRELRRALRSLLRAPGFTLPAVVTLAVGLGATAAIFTLVDAILLHPLPYPAADRVVRVYHVFKGSEGGANPIARFAYPFLRDANHSFEAMGGYWSPSRYTISGDDAAERVQGVQATVGLLAVLGARPGAGRLFTADDAGLGDASGVVISQRLWRRRYGSDPALVGRVIQIDGAPRPVLGVMADGVDLPEVKIDLWIPYVVPPGTPADDAFRIQVLARLREGVDVAAATADVQALTGRFPEFGAFYRTYLNDLGLSTEVRPLRDDVVGGIQRPLWILMGAVLIVLLVAAANVATLFLVRAEGRRHEVAVRTALGAGRGGLLAHFLAESLWVAAVAGAAALALAVGAVRVFTSLAPPAVPRLDEVRVAGPTAAVVLVLSVAVAVGLGLYPFLRFGRAGRESLRARGTGDSRAQVAVGGGFVVAQVALALVLLSGSALLVRTFRELRAVDPGFQPAGVLVSELSLPAPSYPGAEEVRVFRDRLLEAVEALPGVRGAAFGPSPLAQGGCNGLYVEGMTLPAGQFPPCEPVVFVSPGYWELMGIRSTAGRTLAPADEDPGVPAVAVVSESVARRLWPDGDPLAGGVHPSPRHGPPWFRVVGVVGSVRGHGPEQPPTDAVYLPVGTMDGEGWLDRSLSLLVRTAAGRESEVVPALRRAVTGLDAAVPLTVTGSLADEQARTMSRSTLTLYLLGGAAATALALGLVGLYGVVAYRVGTRRAEIGLRMALGAPAAQVRALVLRHSLRLVATGTVLGLTASAFLTRFLSSLLFGVRPGDPGALALAAVALVLTALAAAWIPAQRATRVDPATALRNE
jgi:putative ABC transport system permease protein